MAQFKTALVVTVLAGVTAVAANAAHKATDASDKTELSDIGIGTKENSTSINARMKSGGRRGNIVFEVPDGRPPSTVPDDIPPRPHCRRRSRCKNYCPKLDLQSLINQLNKLKPGMKFLVETTNEINGLQELIERLARGGSSVGKLKKKYLDNIRDTIQNEMEQSNEKLEKVVTKSIKNSCSSGKIDSSSLVAQINSMIGKTDLLITSRTGNGNGMSDVVRSILDTVTHIKSSVTIVTNNVCNDPRITNIEIILKQMGSPHSTVTRAIRSIRSDIRTVTKKVTHVGSRSYSQKWSKKIDNLTETFQTLKNEISDLKQSATRQ